MSCVNGKGAVLLVHPHSLISTFAVRCLASCKCLFILHPKASMATKTGLSHIHLKSPKTNFITRVHIFSLRLSLFLKKSQGDFVVKVTYLSAERGKALKLSAKWQQRLYIDSNTPHPFYNTVRYNTVLAITRISAGPQMVNRLIFLYILLSI